MKYLWNYHDDQQRHWYGRKEVMEGGERTRQHFRWAEFSIYVSRKSVSELIKQETIVEVSHTFWVWVNATCFYKRFPILVPVLPTTGNSKVFAFMKKAVTILNPLLSFWEHLFNDHIALVFVTEKKNNKSSVGNFSFQARVPWIFVPSADNKPGVG